MMGFQKHKTYFNITKDEFLTMLGLHEEDLLTEEVGDNQEFWMYPFESGTPAIYCYDNDVDSIRMYQDRRVQGDNVIVTKKYSYRKVVSRKTGDQYKDGRWITRNWIPWRVFHDFS